MGYIKTVFFTAVVLLAYYWQVHIIRGPVFKTNKKLNGKTVLITGGNEGIGKAAAIEFAKLGARVVIASRNEEKSKAAQIEIMKESKNKNVHVMQLDLENFENVRLFATNFVEEEEHLDFLVNNAGVAVVQGLSENGFSRVSTINHFGPFLLTALLIDKVKEQSRNRPVRIVNVAGDIYKLSAGILDVEQLREEASTLHENVLMYSYSKLANIYFTSELNRRVKDYGITAYSLHPGVIVSQLGQDSKIVPDSVKTLITFVVRLFSRSPYYGAQTILYCALDDDVIKHSGDYFVDCARTELEDYARDEPAAKKLWRDSLKVTELHDY